MSMDKCSQTFSNSSHLLDLAWPVTVSCPNISEQVNWTEWLVTLLGCTYVLCAQGVSPKTKEFFLALPEFWGSVLKIKYVTTITMFQLKCFPCASHGLHLYCFLFTYYLTCYTHWCCSARAMIQNAVQKSFWLWGTQVLQVGLQP